MTRNTAPWFMSLTESVSALGMATREYRAAYRASQTAAWHIDPARVLPVDGSVSIPDRSEFVRPHEAALWQLGEAHKELNDRTYELYENAALAYAYGTGDVVLAIALGGRPQYIQLGCHDGLYVQHCGALNNLSHALGEWAGTPRLAEIADELHQRQIESRWLEDLPALDYEPDTLADTAEFAAGLADTAYAYGEMAERALHFLLLSNKTDRTPEEGQR